MEVEAKLPLITDKDECNNDFSDEGSDKYASHKFIVV